MITRYIPTSTEPVAKDLSEALWSLSRPASVRGADTTSQMFGTVIDLHGESWLEVLEEFEIPVHTDAVLNGIADILQPWIDAGNLPADTNDQLAALIESKRGGQLVVWQAIPGLFKAMSKTRAQMVEAGLLANP
jgi:hypothetical protein